MFDYIPDHNISPELRPITSVGMFAGLVLNVLLGITITISIVTIIIGGIQYVTSAGDPKAVAVARTTIMYSVIAMVLAIGALTIKTIILRILGVTTGEISNVVPTF